MLSASYVIIGAGFAGAATAYHLARQGVEGILILEQEAMAGVHASGRNAAMVRQVVSEPSLLELTREGAAFLQNPPSDWPAPLNYRRNGSLLLGNGEGWEKLSREAQVARQNGIDVESWSAERAKEYVPVLRDASFDGALWCPTDGVIDIHALLSGFLKGAISAGAQIRYHSTVRGIEVKDGAVTAISTDSETVRTHAVIDAAGAWAGSIGERVHAVKVPLRPCRRHLFVTTPLPWADPGWPFVWDLTHDLYFRPEAGGLLLCPCDQDEMAPGTPATEASIVELLADKINRHLPGISNIAIKRSWAGLRTLTPDGRFVIGWDPKLNGFFWVAGIGGHGVTVSSSVGALAARLILEKGRPEAEQFSPRRFLRESSTSIPASHSS